MLWKLIATEVGRMAIGNIKNVNKKDLQRLVRAVRPHPGIMLAQSLGAFGAGVALGAGLGVLTAPRSGKQTREALSKTLQDWLGPSEQGAVTSEGAAASTESGEGEGEKRANGDGATTH